VNLCVVIGTKRARKIAVAAVFHDLGIWANGTFDYIAPSIALAPLPHPRAPGLGRRIEGMIADHHKITPSTASQIRSSKHSGEPTGST
jgi:hypothetical protein